MPATRPANSRIPASRLDLNSLSARGPLSILSREARGAVVRYELHDGVIHSAARMTYTDVSAILTERDPEVTARYTDLVPLFERMRELFEILNKRRRRRGSLSD